MMNLVFIPLAFFGVFGGALLSLILWVFVPAGLWMLVPPVACAIILCAAFAGALR